MLTAEHIIAELYSSREVRELFNCLPSLIREDARQYVFMDLWQREVKRPGWLEGLNNRGTLRHYIARMVFNISANKRHTFHDTQTISPERCEVGHILENRPEDATDMQYHEAVEDCSERVDTLYWYYAELLRRRTECKSDRELAREIGLPRSTVQDGLTKARTLVKKMIRISPKQ